MNSTELKINLLLFRNICRAEGTSVKHKIKDKSIDVDKYHEVSFSTSDDEPASQNSKTVSLNFHIHLNVSLHKFNKFYTHFHINLLLIIKL